MRVHVVDGYVESASCRETVSQCLLQGWEPPDGFPVTRVS